MKILLTGGHGFIGSRVMRQLSGKGHELRCLVRASSNTRRIDELPFTKFVGDIKDRASLVPAMTGAEAVIHLASVSAWSEIRSGNVQPTIIEGTQNVLEVAKQAGVKRVVYVSSTLAVNGSAEPRVFNEDSPFELKDSKLVYSTSKRAAEDLARSYAKDGLEVVIVNPAEVYGAEDDTFVTAGNLKDILSSWPALVCKGGTAVVHVDDVAQGIILALQKGRSGERYILGGENLSVDQLARLTLEIAGQNKPVLQLPNGLLKGLINGMAKVGIPTPVIPDVLDYATLYWFMDSSKAKRELGFSPRPPKEAITPAIEWLYSAGHLKGSMPSGSRTTAA